MFILNEIEGELISKEKGIPSILAKLKNNYPNAQVIITQGKDGVIYQDNKNIFKHGSYNVNVVDTTAAGDTFTGYFLAFLSKKIEIPRALELSSKAAALAVTKKGAACSIPYLNEVQNVQLILL